MSKNVKISRHFPGDYLPRQKAVPESSAKDMERCQAENLSSSQRTVGKLTAAKINKGSWWLHCKNA